MKGFSSFKGLNVIFIKEKIIDYFLLTKPKIMILVVFTGATSLWLYENSVSFSNFIFILLGLYFTGGSANALNQCFEYKIDGKMSRTAKKRPLPQKKITYIGALIFSIFIGFIGILLFFLIFNFLSALLALITILFYSLFYTLVLKPNTHQNIVIGGASGSMPPVIAWAAISNNILDAVPWILFFIIFFWTPPHFWALALYYKDDYEKAGFPMYPIVKGNEATFLAIIIYTIIVVALTFIFAFIYNEAKWFYLFIITIFGFIFIMKAFQVKKYKTIESEKNLFSCSIIYLFSIFIAAVLDKFFI